LNVRDSQIASEALDSDDEVTNSQTWSCAWFQPVAARLRSAALVSAGGA